MDATRIPTTYQYITISTMERKDGKNRSLCSNETLQEAIRAIDVKYTYVEVSPAFCISRTILKDHYLSKRTSRKMKAKKVLSKEEDDALCKYILDMAEIGLPFILIK